MTYIHQDSTKLISMESSVSVHLGQLSYKYLNTVKNVIVNHLETVSDVTGPKVHRSSVIYVVFM